MGCNCKVTEIIFALVILVFAFVDAMYAKWIVAIAGVLLIIHALTCRNIAACASGTMVQAAQPKAKKR